MSLDRDRVIALADETGFRPETLEKVMRLGELLGDIGRHPFLSKALTLKGGTALNLFFGAPRRLSVDLDFNYIAQLDRDRMLEDRPEVERAILLIGRGRGYHLQQSAEEHAGRKTFLTYRTTAGTQDRIEVDLNYLFRLPLLPVRLRAMWQPGDLPRPRARVVAVEELVAGKLCALLDRGAARDLFDVAQLPLLLGGRWKTRRLRRAFIAFAGALDHPLYRYGRERLDRVSDDVIRRELWPTLTRDERPAAEELKERAWAAAARLFALDDVEREYCDQIQQGELQPELLFPHDRPMADRLRRHPALLWKVDNARKHAARSGRKPRKKVE